MGSSAFWGETDLGEEGRVICKPGRDNREEVSQEAGLEY